MTSKTITTCDRCKRELSEGDYRARFSWEEIGYATAGSSGRVSEVIVFEDVCATCSLAVREQLNGIRR